jgi:DNA-binding IclR family transcriptional regulator
MIFLIQSILVSLYFLKKIQKGEMTTASTVIRAFEILDYFLDHNYEVSVSDVSNKLGISKSTAHRLLSTMEKTNILTKSKNRPRYCLDKKILELAQAYLSNLNLETTSHPYLKELNSKTGETICVYVRKGGERVCIDRIDSTHKIRQVLNIGDRRPLCAGAPGKLLLAYLSDYKIDSIIKRTGLKRYTNHTITSKREIKTEIANIRKKGLAISFGEHIDLVAAVSAPIKTFGGEVIASLSIIWIDDSLDSKKVNDYSILIKEAANKVSQDMGYLSPIK